MWSNFWLLTYLSVCLSISMTVQRVRGWWWGDDNTMMRWQQSSRSHFHSSTWTILMNQTPLAAGGGGELGVGRGAATHTACCRMCSSAAHGVEGSWNLSNLSMFFCSSSLFRADEPVSACHLRIKGNPPPSLATLTVLSQRRAGAGQMMGFNSDPSPLLILN